MVGTVSALVAGVTVLQPFPIINITAPGAPMKLKALLSSTAIVVASFLGAGQAQAAFQFTATGQSYTTSFSTTYDGISLSANITYTLASFSATGNNRNAVFNVVVNNTTANQTGSNRLAGFGISVVTPTLTSAQETFSGLQIDRTETFDGTSNDVDLCLFAGGSCDEMSNSGVNEASSSTGTITLGFGSSAFANGFSVNFGEPYYVRFVRVGEENRRDETTIACTSNAACVTTNRALPEPASLALVGLGLLAAGAVRRRRA